MKTIVRYYSMSTGYPTYKKEDKKPVPGLGSDSVYYPDNRFSKENIMRQAEIRRQKLNEFYGYERFIGWVLNYGNNLHDMRPYHKSRPDLPRE